MGVARMSAMMLTGRVYDQAEGVQAGLAQYAVADGEGFAKAMELARRIAGNAKMSNYAVMHALPRIADQSQSEGLFTESLMAAVAESTPDAKSRLRDFLEGRAGKVATLESRPDGTSILRSTEALRWFPSRVTDALEQWAAEAPDRTFVAKRHQGGDWRRISYAEMLQRAQAVGQALSAVGNIGIVTGAADVDREYGLLKTAYTSYEANAKALAEKVQGSSLAPLLQQQEQSYKAATAYYRSTLEKIGASGTAQDA
eukprot:gene53562-71587_t